MKPTKYLIRDKKTELVKEKNEKEKYNDENEEEEAYIEEIERNKEILQKQKTPQSLRPVINKDIKTNIIKRDEKPKMPTQGLNRQNIIYIQNTNNNNNISKDGNNIKRGIQDKNQTLTAASRIIAKKESQRANQKQQQYTIKLSQNSPKGQLKTKISHITSTKLKPQNSHAQLIRPQIPSKIENQTQPPQNNTNYVRRVVESTVHKEDNSKEIKIINRNNNYTINVTNNNNTINVTNNNNNTNTNSNKEQYEKNKAQEKEVKIKTEPKKEPRKELRIQEKERERENLTKKESEKYYNRKEEEIIIKDNKEKLKTNNNYNNDNKKENKLNNEFFDRRREYVTNETLIKNGIEIFEFSPEETQKVLEKKKESGEMRKRKKEEKLNKKKKYINRLRNNNDNNIKDYYKKDTYNIYRPYSNFYIRGKDNFSKRNIRDREVYTKTDNYDDRYEDYNNRSFDGLESFNDNRRDYIKRNDRHDSRHNRRINNFYERGRPNSLFRGFRGRRGRY